MLPEALCSRCQQIPLDALLYGPYDVKIAQTSLRQLEIVWNAETCPFCLFVKDILAKHYGKDYVDGKLAQGVNREILLYRESLDLSFNEFDARNGVEREMPFRLEIGLFIPPALQGNPGSHFSREDRLRADDRTLDWVMPSIIGVKHQIEYANKDMEAVTIEQPGRLVDHTKIDWSLLNKWDSACSHQSLAPRNRLQQPRSVTFACRSRLRVIDVDRACVIHCPPGATYVALSYQWGSDQNLKLKKENIAQLETPGFLNSAEGQPAGTIKDAILTVRRLGYKYAWVDALCIVVCFFPSLIARRDTNLCRSKMISTT
jgi:hypothetical protein